MAPSEIDAALRPLPDSPLYNHLMQTAMAFRREVLLYAQPNDEYELAPPARLGIVAAWDADIEGEDECGLVRQHPLMAEETFFYPVHRFHLASDHRDAHLVLFATLLSPAFVPPQRRALLSDRVTVRRPAWVTVAFATDTAFAAEVVLLGDALTQSWLDEDA